MSGPEIAALNARHGIPDRIVFKEGPRGLAVADVANDRATAAIALQGAQLLTWTRRGEPPTVWLSPGARFAAGKSVRGGVPVCWPWFGPHPTQPSFPAHGFARTSPWEVKRVEAPAADVARLELRLVPGEASHALWPHPSELECHIEVGAALEISLVTRNTGPAPFTIGEALHAYFTVGDVRRIAVEGLVDAAYLDKVDGGRRKRQSGAVHFEGEVDRLFLDTRADCTIVDPQMRRRIRIRKGGSDSTVVWNPWIEKAQRLSDMGPEGYLTMVCVESANAADNLVTVPPGAEHRLWVRYEVEPLG